MSKVFDWQETITGWRCKWEGMALEVRTEKIPDVERINDSDMCFRPFLDGADFAYAEWGVEEALLITEHAALLAYYERQHSPERLALGRAAQQLYVEADDMGLPAVTAFDEVLAACIVGCPDARVMPGWGCDDTEFAHLAQNQVDTPPEVDAFIAEHFDKLVGEGDDDE